MDKKTIQREAAKLRRDVLKYIKSCNPNAKNAKQYLHPKYAFEMFGVTYEERPDLDLELRVVDEQTRVKLSVTTGRLDRRSKVVATSERSPPAERLFTAAHELGHWILHKDEMIEHRDRPPHGARTSRPRREREADEFAAAYLMPPKWVEGDLESRFGTPPVNVDEHLAWWLDQTDHERLLLLNTDADEERARTIAVCTNIGMGHFCSLADEYGVTAKAMALRLMELGLVKRDHLR